MASRWLKKGWQDKRPGFRKRVRWFEGTHDVRLNFWDADEGRECNRFYPDPTEAQGDFDAFVAGNKTVLQLMEEGEHGRDDRDDSEES